MECEFMGFKKRGGFRKGFKKRGFKARRRRGARIAKYGSSRGGIRL